MRPLFAQLIDVPPSFTSGWDLLRVDFPLNVVFNLERKQIGMRTA